MREGLTQQFQALDLAWKCSGSNLGSGKHKFQAPDLALECSGSNLRHENVLVQILAQGNTAVSGTGLGMKMFWFESQA